MRQKNVQETLTLAGPEPAVLKALEALKLEAIRLRTEERELETLSRRQLDIDDSIADLRSRTKTAITALPARSREFNDLLRKLVPEFHVYLVRSCDGGHLLRPASRWRSCAPGRREDAWMLRVPASTPAGRLRPPHGGSAAPRPIDPAL